MEVQTGVNPWWALTVWCGECRQCPASGRVPFSRAYRKHGGRLPSRLRDDRSCDPVDCGTHRVCSHEHRLVALGRYSRVLQFYRAQGFVDYAWPVEFRVPIRCDILLLCLVLLFGAILLMGLPMFRLHRQL